MFQVQTAYDALNRITSRTTPDGSVTLPTYNQAGLLETVRWPWGPAPSPGTVISNIDYNARGQRVLYDYSDPTITPSPAQPATTCEVTYTYDPFTFRLTHLTTNRPASGAYGRGAAGPRLHLRPGRERCRDRRQRRPDARLRQCDHARPCDGPLPLRLALPPHRRRGASTRASSSRPARSTSPRQHPTSPERPAGADPVHGELHLRPGRQHPEDRAHDLGSAAGADLDAQLPVRHREQPPRRATTTRTTSAERSATHTRTRATAR